MTDKDRLSEMVDKFKRFHNDDWAVASHELMYLLTNLAAESRRKTIEECAIACDGLATWGKDNVCSITIRSLIDSTPDSTPAGTRGEKGKETV